MPALTPRIGWIVAGIGSMVVAVAAAWVVAGPPDGAPAGAGSSSARTLSGALGPDAGLEVEARPRRFPVLGPVFARLAQPGVPRTPPLGLARFAWGGETISVARLQVPDALLDVPLVLIADGEGGFLLTTDRGVALADGAVGTEVRGRDPKGGAVRILVTDLVARAGTEFVVRKRGCADAIAAARARGETR